MDAVFLDISQAFDKVWHPGLLHKWEHILPYNLLKSLESHFSDRNFFVKAKSESTDIYKIKSGVPQGSILGTVLYTLYTSDLPLSQYTYTATFADDTVIMAVNKYPDIASTVLQQSLNGLQEWIKPWGSMANANKSPHITFTLKKVKCPSVSLNGSAIFQTEVVRYRGIHLDQRLHGPLIFLIKGNSCD